MAKQHQIGGKKAQGFAALPSWQRQARAIYAGQCCAAKHGHAHMAKIGRKGGKAFGRAMRERRKLGKQ